MKRTFGKNKLINNIKDVIVQYIANNAKNYLIVTSLFFIGIIIGIMFINRSKVEQIDQISNYITQFINNIKQGGKIEEAILLKDSIIKNVKISVLLWLLGLTVIGIPFIYLILCYQGFCIGYTCSSIIATIGTGKGILFIIVTMLFQYILYIPCIFTLAISGIKLYKQIMEDRRSKNIKLQIIRHTILCIFILIILLLSSIIETYVSGNLATFFIKYC